jgi:hypothetical protein
MAVNVPATVWRGADNSEYSNGSSSNIADSSLNQLVDSSGVFVVDTGVTQTPVPATVWAENDGV